MRMQRNGEELGGTQPVTPHTCYRDEPEAQQFIMRQKWLPPPGTSPADPIHPPLLPDPRLFWDPIVNGMNQVAIDGLTIDARNAAKRRKVLAKRNHPVPIAYNNVSKASVGGAPVTMMYLSVHATAGSQGVFPRTGAKGGKKGSLESAVRWHEELPESWRNQIKEFSYYNHAAALKKMTKKEFPITEPFDYKMFKVCSNSSRHFSASGCPFLSHNVVKGKRSARAATSFASSRFFLLLSCRCSDPQTSMPSHCLSVGCTTRSTQKSAPFTNNPVLCARP